MRETRVLGMLACFATFLSVSCNSPADPGSQPNPGGDLVAWFNGMGYTVDLFFPQSDSLVSNAYNTGSIPNDILSFASGRIAVLSSMSATVEVFDTDSSGGSVSVVNLPPGSNPYLMSWDGDHLWVTLLLSGQVAKVDLASASVIEIMDVKPNPLSIASSGEMVFVGHGAGYPDPSVSGGITVLDASSGTLLDSIDTPDNVCFLRYFESTGMVHAVTTTYMGDGMITIIDAQDLSIVNQISTGGSPCYPAESEQGFLAGDGWSSGNIYFYSEDTGLEDIWNTGLSSSTGLACSGDTVYITDFNSDMVCIADMGDRILLDTLTAGSSGPQGISLVER